MAYEVIPESGEEVLTDVRLHLSEKAQPFYFAVSNQAIYIPRIKLIAKTDPFYFQRVPLDQVREVLVRRLRPYGLWVLTALMIPTGLITTILMMEPLLRREPGIHEVNGWPVAVFVGGLIIPFIAHGRFALHIAFNEGSYRWKPPLVVDRSSREKIRETMRRIIETCHRLGVPVAGESMALLERGSRVRR